MCFLIVILITLMLKCPLFDQFGFDLSSVNQDNQTLVS